MEWYWWVAIIGIAIKLLYIIGTFIVVKYFIPLFGYEKPVIRKIPKDMQMTIDQLRLDSHSKEEYLQNTYLAITAKYQSEFGGMWKYFPLHFETSWQKIWQRKGYIPCHHFAHLMRIFLVKSGMFNDNDIKFKISIYDWCVHQYCVVKVNGIWIPVGVCHYHPFSNECQ